MKRAGNEQIKWDNKQQQHKAQLIAWSRPVMRGSIFTTTSETILPREK
jgi:hypothetical protein